MFYLKPSTSWKMKMSMESHTIKFNYVLVLLLSSSVMGQKSHAASVYKVLPIGSTAPTEMKHHSENTQDKEGAIP